jgi:hypothetical protein
MASLQEYVELMEEDAVLRDMLTRDPGGTLTQARISLEDKKVLEGGDPDAVARAAGVSDLSPAVREVIKEVGKHFRHA